MSKKFPKTQNIQFKNTSITFLNKDTKHKKIIWKVNSKNENKNIKGGESP